MKVTLVVVFLGLLCAIDAATAQTTGVQPGTVRPIPSPNSSDTATAKDYGGWIEWKSNHSGTKTQFLPHCDEKVNGAQITIIDGAYNAASNKIDIKVTGETSNVDGVPGGRSIESNGGVMHLVCDGINNWIVLFDSETGATDRYVTDLNLMNGGNQFTCNPATNANCYCNPAGTLCSIKSYEDTLRGTDNAGLVTYNSSNAVDVGLPRNEAHSAFRPGWMTTVKNAGTGTVTITATPPSTIDDGTIAAGGSWQYVVHAHTAIEIYSRTGLHYDVVPLSNDGVQP